MGKKYMDTKDGTLESSILGVWQEAAKKQEKLDPVGKEDGDIDNDGDKDASDKYLAKRRKTIAKAMKKEVPPIVTLNNKWKAYKKGRNVMLTIPNPNVKVETNKPFIRVNAKEVWRNPNEVYMMKS